MFFAHGVLILSFAIGIALHDFYAIIVAFSARFYGCTWTRIAWASNFRFNENFYLRSVIYFLPFHSCVYVLLFLISLSLSFAVRARFFLLTTVYFDFNRLYLFIYFAILWFNFVCLFYCRSFFFPHSVCLSLCYVCVFLWIIRFILMLSASLHIKSTFRLWQCTQKKTLSNRFQNANNNWDGKLQSLKTESIPFAAKAICCYRMRWQPHLTIDVFDWDSQNVFNKISKFILCVWYLRYILF